jgi:CheY-like chemotaxis protein/ubiquinone/menaquinone biosynthesis C-methylase UbiE
MRILCVDDDQVTLLKTVKTLQSMLPGDSVWKAGSGEAALEQLRVEPVDLVITDLVMPGLSGLDVLRETKTRYPRTEVVMLTGHAAIDTAVEAIRLGALDYLTKPLEADLIIEKVEQVRTYLLRRQMLDGKGVEVTFARTGGTREAIQESLSDSLQRLRAIAEVVGGVGSNDERLAKIREMLDAPRAGLPSIAPKSGPQVVTATKQLYDQTASGWVRDKPSSLSDYTARPAVFELCEPVKGKRVLDLGCGEGYCTRELRRRGAEISGIDVSDKMIDGALEAEKKLKLGISYSVGDATKLPQVANASLDMVLAVFLFNYLTVDQTRACMSEVARIVKPGGHFVFSIPHPAFPYMREHAPPFYFDVPKGAGYFAGRNQHFSGKIWKRGGQALDVQLVHKTFEDYFECLAEAGFRKMPVVQELHALPEHVELDPDFFGPLGDVPLHVAFKVER